MRRAVCRTPEVRVLRRLVMFLYRLKIVPQSLDLDSRTKVTEPVYYSRV